MCSLDPSPRLCYSPSKSPTAVEHRSPPPRIEGIGISPVEDVEMGRLPPVSRSPRPKTVEILLKVEPENGPRPHGRRPKYAMPKTRVQKEEIVARLADKARRMKSAVFTSIGGYTMEDADALRANGRKEGVELVVAKKTLLTRALKDAGLDVPADVLDGSILTAFGMQDEIAPAKLVAALAKDREQIKIVGGVMEGKAVDAAYVQTLAMIPSRLELYAKLVGSINNPVSGFVRVLNAIATKDEDAAPAEAAPAEAAPVAAAPAA